MFRFSLLGRRFGTQVTSRATGKRIVALALGSNIGDRVANIEGALSYLERNSDVRVVDTSFLYETQPMYVSDQPKFINAACLISSSLEPQALLRTIKDAEDHQGRTPTIRNGPRVVDLDILFDENHVYQYEQEPSIGLIVPHPRIAEREFVLRPLADLIPDFYHPVHKTKIGDLLTRVKSEGDSIYRIINFPASYTSSNPTPVIWRLGERTFIMATLNTTPDSFSDGGENNTWESAIKYSQEAVSHDADMIDIGGYSTRPGSSPISVEEEIARTVPFITELRNKQIELPISVDTFRAEVAEKCLGVGANCINDVYGLTGAHDEEIKLNEKTKSASKSNARIADHGAMLQVATNSKVPVIIMHSRGKANRNKDYSNYGHDVIEGVRFELGARVERALKAGVRRWNIILDPGIGFSKSVEDNLRLIRHHAKLNMSQTIDGTSSHSLRDSPRPGLVGFPTLVGTSRKGFLGEVMAREVARKNAKTRDWATAAAVTSLVQQGVDIVRVHSVEAMRDVIKVADAIWRNNS
ncbi:Dihydropteroate synthase [Serendipita vermifera]|nr:Dihydropteroate synthase [Serendipita vermifera]